MSDILTAVNTHYVHPNAPWLCNYYFLKHAKLMETNGIRRHNHLNHL